MKLSHIHLTEAEDKRPTKTRTSTNWNSLFGGSKELPTQSTKQTISQQPSAPADEKPMKAVSGDITRQRMSGVRPTADIASKLAQMDLSAEDEISNDQAAINAGLGQQTANVPVVQGTDIAQVSTAIEKSQGIVPEWHMVKHLPGYLASGIRSMGRAVFSAFTTTPIEEIQVLANVGDGPNEQEEIDAVFQYIHQHGQRDSEAELEFQERIPNYGAKVKIYKALGYTFMAVRDFAGSYIYAWPEKDGDGLSDRTQRPRLK